jgi:polysaccharide pyruvyl transferase WcaK-like protein
MLFSWGLKMKPCDIDPIRIYIDHWEDYESIGDKAMLLNAVRRLEIHLGQCVFVGPHSPNKAGNFLFPGMLPVLPPHGELTRIADWFRSVYTRLAGLLPVKAPASRINSKKYLDLARFIFSIKLTFYSIGLRFVFNESFRDFLDKIKKCDLFFTVGDCSLNDYWLDGVVYKSWLVELVRRYVPVCVLSSQGIGPLTVPWARRRLVGALKKLDILSFRDFAYSQALVEAEGLKDVPSKIVGDEAFSLPVASQEQVRSVLDGAGISRGEPFIAVNFRKTDFTQSTAFLLDKIALLLDAVIKETSRAIVFVPMSTGNDYGCDHEAGSRLKRMMEHHERFFVLEPLGDPSLAKGIIAAAAYSMGVSYHLHVFSLSAGHPTVVLYTGNYYQTKSEGLISFYGSPSRAVDFSVTGVEQTLELVRDIEKQYDNACAHVREVNKLILEDNDWTIEMVKSALIRKGRHARVLQAAGK